MLSKKVRLPRLVIFVISAALSALALGCSGESDTPTPGVGSEASAAVLSSAALEGETLFNRSCLACHGVKASGTQTGPPLVHEIYLPGHHPDIAFRNAVKNGVIAHHWEFGHMPPQPGVSEEDVERIICYVRELQVAGGIYVGDAC